MRSREKHELKNCASCGKEFLARVREVKAGRANYCSYQCSNLACRSGAKLTWTQVDEIRAAYKGGRMSYGRLAIRYQVTGPAIAAICTNSTWHPKTRTA